MNKVKTSKFLSLILRHAPETVGIELDANGWASVAELLAGSRRHGKILSRDQLEDIVFSNDKQRFAFSLDGTMIRANQGHSIGIELGLSPIEPPALLFHGTATRFLDAIRSDGLRKMNRQHVHLSSQKDQAERVGARHGKAIVLEIDCQTMSREGCDFFVSANGVWLTNSVPIRFIKELDLA